MKSLISGFAVLFLSAAALPAQTAATVAKAELVDSQGKKAGTAELTQALDGVKIVLTVSGLAPGQHAFHIHTVGKCEGPDFKSAGAHFDPTTKSTDSKIPRGRTPETRKTLRWGRTGQA